MLMRLSQAMSCKARRQQSQKIDCQWYSLSTGVAIEGYNTYIRLLNRRHTHLIHGLDKK